MAANTAVVGILRTMLTMDTASFEAGAKKSDTTLKLVENSTKKLGAEVAKLTPQAERMVKAFSGDKLLYSANNIVAAVTKIGGATKLTATEQEKANRTLTAAIEKYAAMGQVAPKAMLDLEQATRKAEAPTSFLTTKMVALGAAAGTFLSNLAFQGVRTLVGFGREAFNTAGRLTDLANKTGLSTETIQRMSFVADQTNTTLEALTNAAFRLGVQIAGGSNSVTRAVDDLGLSFAEIQRMRPDQQFETIVGALSKVDNQQERNRIGVVLFGRQFAEIAASVEEGYEGIASAATISTDAQLRALDAASDRWTAFVTNTKANVTSFLGSILVMHDELRKIEQEQGRRPNEPGGRPNAAIDELQRRIVLGLIGARREDIALTEEQVEAQKTYVEQLKAVQKELAGLTTSQRQELDAAQKLGVGTDELEAKYGLTEGALRLLNTQTREAAKATKSVTDEYAKLNREMANLAGEGFLAHDFELMRQSTVTGDPLKGLTPVSDDIFLPSQRIAGAMGAPAPALKAQLQEQGRQISDFWRAQMGQIEGATLGRLGMLFLGQLGHDVTGELKAAADEAELDFLRIQRSGKATAEELSLAFERWREAEDRAAYDFGERFSDMMGGIKQTFVGVLDDMLQHYLKQFLGGLIKGASSARLAQGIGNLVAGGGTGALLGGGASVASSVAGASAIGGGTAAAGSAGGAAAGVGAGVGIGTTLAITGGVAGAALLGWAIWKKGLFRGGEEALHISPRRDRLFGQLQDMFGGSQFEAAATAFSKAKVRGDVAERLIGNVYAADSKKDYDPAQAAFVNALVGGGLKTVKGFSMGGFVPPGVVQPAILHGGQFGEDIVPRTSSLGSGQKIELHQHYSTTFHAHAMNTDGFDRVFKNEFLPRLQWEYRLNQQGTVTVLEKALGI